LYPDARRYDLLLSDQYQRLLLRPSLKEEYQARGYIVVSMDTNPRRTEDGIEILPWKVFLDRLWANEIINI
jgi:hypothetical protein